MRIPYPPLSWCWISQWVKRGTFETLQLMQRHARSQIPDVMLVLANPLVFSEGPKLVFLGQRKPPFFMRIQLVVA